MFDSFKEALFSSVSIENIVVIILGIIIGFIIKGIFIEYPLKIRSWWKSIKRRARCEFYSKNNKNSDDVISLDYGVPHFIINHNSIIDNEEEFRLNFPLEKLRNTHKAYIEDIEKEQSFLFDEDKIFGKKDKGMEFLVDTTGIKDLPDRINTARKAVAQQFANREGGNYFNSRTVGVRRCGFCRIGEREQPALDITVYRTDYFTHKVMQDVIHDLLNEKIVKINEIEKQHALLYEKYFPFLTSLGLNVFILTNGERILNLCRRSSNASNVNSNQSGKLHVTMNEGLTATDYENRELGNGRLTINNCYRRGMREELGINNNLGEIKVYDLFFSKSHFQIGLFAWASYGGRESDLRDSRAPDRALECAGMHQCGFNSKSIQTLLKEKEFTSYSKTGLKNLCRLHDIKLEDDEFSVQYWLYLFRIALGITGR